MSKERLEEIKNSNYFFLGLRNGKTELEKNWRFLIQQAEEKIELEERFETLSDIHDRTVEENQRYKQTLEEILRQHENEEEIDDYDFMWNVQQIASKALEGGNENE